MRRLAIMALFTAALLVGCNVESGKEAKEVNGTRRNKEVVYVTSINAVNGFTTFKIDSNEYITSIKIPAKYSVPEKTYTYRINGTRCIVATNNVCYSFNEIK